MEFVLKHPQFTHLSENPLEVDTICPSDANSLALIEELIGQVFHIFKLEISAL